MLGTGAWAVKKGHVICWQNLSAREQGTQSSNQGELADGVQVRASQESELESKSEPEP